MYNRTVISDGPFDPFIIEHDGKKHQYTDLYKFAEIGNPRAGISQSVLKSREKEYMHLVVVADDDPANSNGTRRGWYSTHSLSKQEALDVRKSWAVLREQPADPGGPWAD